MSLLGKTIAITEARRAAEMSSLIAKLGGVPYSAPSSYCCIGMMTQMEDHSGPLPAGPQVAAPLGAPEKGLCASYALASFGAEAQRESRRS